MTLLFARIRSPAEAGEAQRAGFDGVASDTAMEAAGALAVLAPGERGWLGLVQGDGDIGKVKVFLDALPDPATVASAAAEGATAILLDAAGRLVERWGLPALAEVRASCRTAGLGCGLAGGIEPPDLPRVLALKPTFLVVGRALRNGSDLDAAALRLFRDLVPVAGGQPRPDRPGTPLAPGRPDRIFVRDMVVSMGIGAYHGERDRLQRVRFSVEADLADAGRRVQDMRDVVSYDLFTDAIRLLTTGHHVDLVETLAEDLAAAVLAHPRILAVRITIEKLEVGPGTVGVSIERARA